VGVLPGGRIAVAIVFLRLSADARLYGNTCYMRSSAEFADESCGHVWAVDGCVDSRMSKSVQDLDVRQ
jgi:hypothetical protein